MWITAERDFGIERFNLIIVGCAFECIINIKIHHQLGIRIRRSFVWEISIRRIRLIGLVRIRIGRIRLIFLVRLPSEILW